MNQQLSFLDAAYVIGAGLNLNLFDREEVIAWADQRIAEIDVPPYWLLELATLRDLDPYDAAQVVLAHIPALPPAITCGIILALMPPVAEVPTHQLSRYAKVIYEVVRALCKNDWKQRVLCCADQIDDTFALINNGTIAGTAESIRSEMTTFFNDFAMPHLAASLKPIRCRIPF